MAMAGTECSDGVIDRIVQTLHMLIRDRLHAGNVRVLLEGVDSSEVSARLNVSEVEVCQAARCDPRLVVVEWGETSCKLLTREADALRAVLSSVPHIDFRIYVRERYGLRVYRECRGDAPCLAALAAMVSSAGLGEYAGVLERFFREGAAYHPVFRTPWAYQVDAWREIFHALASNARRSIAVMAGTGEGKTEAFLIPILAYLIVARLRGEKPRVLLLYPRKALATDQLDRILRLVHLANNVLEKHGVKLRVAVLDGDTPHSWWRRGAFLRRKDGDELQPVQLRPSCVSQRSCIGEEVKPYKRVRCPRCSLEGRTSELVVRPMDADALLRRDYVWSRSFIEEELRRVTRQPSTFIRQLPVARMSVSSVYPTLYCPACGVTLDYLYLTKSDLAILEEPDIIIASVDAVGVRLGDPTVNKVFRGVKVVVVDEAHMLTGVSGAHHALIVRRVVHENLDNNPVLVLSSATISNPEDIARTIYPEAGDTRVIDATSIDRYRSRDSITGFNYYLFILPSESISYDTAATSAAFTLLHSRRKVLVFTESRRDAEDVAAYVVQRGETTSLADNVASCRDARFCLVAVDRVSGRLGEQLREWLKDPDWRKTVVAVDTDRLNELRARVERGSGLVDRNEVDYHHAGLVMRERRRIEEEFKSGRIRLLAATSTLELGIDIGELDTILLLGFPRIPASFFQRAGRAGRRRGTDTLIVTLLRGSYRDLHYYANIADILANPRRYFRVNLDIEGVPELLASHTLMRILDELAAMGVGYSQATLATLTLASRLGRDNAGFLSKTWSRLVQEFLRNPTRLNIAPTVNESIRVINYIAEALERCKDLRTVIALTSIIAWPPVDTANVKQFLESYITSAKRCIENLLNEIYDECKVGRRRSHSILDVLREERSIVESLRSRGIEPLPSELLETLRCLEHRFTEAAVYTAILEKFRELEDKLRKGEGVSEEDVAPLTLDSFLERVRKLYVLGGV